MKTQPTISSDDMRRLEQDAISSGKVTGLELMERAGQGVVDAIFEHWPEFKTAPDVESWNLAFNEDEDTIRAKRALVLCGPGNNGGDGFVVARLLHQMGWQICVAFYGDVDRLGPDARTNYDRWREIDEVLDIGFPKLYDPQAEWFWLETQGGVGTALVIDALFGIGLNREITELQPVLAHIEHFQFLREGEMPIDTPRCVAIDVPSGMDADTGLAPYTNPITSLVLLSIFADLTVTFHRAKPGLLLDRRRTLCGQILVKDIGL